MRRGVLVAVFCFAIGVVVTVAGSWLCIARNRHLTTARPAADTLHGWQAARAGWPAPVPADWPPPRGVSRRASFGAVDVDAWAIPSPGASARTPLGAGASTAGWPWHAMGYHWRSDLQAPGRPPGVYIDGLSHGLVVVPRRATVVGREYRLPLRPLVAGFVANVGFYGVGAWMLLFGVPGQIRRVVRRRRGRCVGCGYDLAGVGGGVCPECGTAVRT